MLRWPVGLCVASTLAIACGTDRGDDGARRFLNQARIPRTFGPRLSVPVSYTVCRDASGSNSAQSVSRCDSPARPTDAISLPVPPGSVDSLDAEALHAVALVDLATATSVIALDRSVSYLEEAARLTTDPNSVQSDLAAALLVRAERTGGVQDIIEAIDIDARVLDHDRQMIPATFNLGLALSRLGLDDEARAAWRRYRVMDSTSEWALETIARSTRQSETPPPAPPTIDDSLPLYARNWPQTAATHVWDSILAEWADETLAGDSSAAHHSLRRAMSIASATRDSTLREAVSAIAASRPASETRGLAVAHKEFAAGHRAYLAAHYDSARIYLARVSSNPLASPPVRAWATVYHAGTIAYSGEMSSAERAARGVIVDNGGRPLVQARARWMLGTWSLRRGAFDSAAALFRLARSSFAAAGERENAAALQYLIGDAMSTRGDPSAVDTLTAALRVLRDYPTSVWRHNTLYILAREAERDSLLHAARLFRTADLRAAQLIGNPLYIAEARLSRAATLVAMGDTAEALREVERAASQFSLLDAPRRSYAEATRRLIVAGEGPETAGLDSVIRYFATQGVEFWHSLALITSAEIALRANDDLRAEVALDELTRTLEMQRASLVSRGDRALLAERARVVFDMMIALRLRRGDAAGALEYLERSRSTDGRAMGSKSRGGFSLPPGQVGLEYAIVSDTLRVWSVRGDRVTAKTVSVAVDSLRRTIARARLALESDRPLSASRAPLALLRGWLIDAAGVVRDSTELRIVAADLLGGVAFAALYDPRAGRYLIQDHVLVSARTLKGSARSRTNTQDRVLLVGDVAIDGRRFPSLLPLPSAKEEIDTLHGLYPAALVLSRNSGTASALRAEVVHATIFHYSGHAVEDIQRPDRSYLPLALDSGTGEDRITVTDIETLDLSGLDLTVLAACRTSGMNAGRATTFINLAGAFLHAGARGVVASLWEIGDRETAAFVPLLHRAYSRRRTAALALRDAQIQSLESAKTGDRPTGTWAAFSYFEN